MSEIPFLKNKNRNQGGGGPIERTSAPTHPDREKSMDDDLMDQVADEFLHAVETKNKGLLKEALRALMQHIQQEDQEQDQGEMS